MWVKGSGLNAKIISDGAALEFAGTIRGQYILSQALTIARDVLIKYETSEEPLSQMAEPSNREDMDILLKAFPLYKIHDEIREEYKQIEEEKKNEKTSS